MRIRSVGIDLGKTVLVQIVEYRRVQWSFES